MPINKVNVFNKLKNFYFLIADIQKSRCLIRQFRSELPNKAKPWLRMAAWDARLKLDEAISRHILRVLEMTKGKVHGKGGAAEVLGINPSILRPG
jgi:hypothetical protein